ncbi:hypothetical protein OB13_14285 [Pontibacter sp. HJ8]
MRLIILKSILLTGMLLLLLQGCRPKEQHLFERLLPNETGITFSNRITESDTMNILETEYIYNGGGVGVGDFNRDGLPDVYFTGNMVPNRLYLNKGDFKFDDITEKARVTGEGKWCSGVAVADINNDGWPDLYVGATMSDSPERRANMLYINNGLNKDGIPTFTESAEAYGIADTGHTTTAAFFDYDKDGDLDLYVLTNVVNAGVPTTYHKKMVDGSSENNDRLYRNNGKGTFTNVTREAGILIEGFGLGIAINDINLDGWPDIYVTNDYLSNDLLYINNRDGTFSNKLGEYVRHTSYSAMGNTVMDINNDGLVDILALDMLPEDNKRKKSMLMANNYATYLNNDLYGYEHQYVRNTLQLNQGMTANGHPVFSEVAQLTGLHQTDWSWTPLVADFDNDGQRDVIVTNGFPRDVTDHDFRIYRSGPAGMVGGSEYLVDSIPVVKITNYGFRNNGNLSFSDVTKSWGLAIPSFSNGAVYADLDNDGDLDVVINTINDSALVYKNTLYTSKSKREKNHYIRLQFEGGPADGQGFGAKVHVYYGGGAQQFYEHSPYRGYLSTLENAAHFGMGANAKADSVVVVWPDGRAQTLLNLAADQVYTLSYKNANGKRPQGGMVHTALFEEAGRAQGLLFRHQEQDQIDFNVQKTLPHKYSQDGPGISVADVNGDGLDDVFVGGAAGNAGTLFLQGKDGKFRKQEGAMAPEPKQEEDTGILFFDADNDDDLDLYCVSGSYEFEDGSPLLRDRFYRNNGAGKFEPDRDALPAATVSGSCVRAADYDQDGDLDLFVGGRVVPGKYPLAPKSTILRNEEGRFTDATAAVCPELQTLGMVADALWTDFDNNGKTDLVVAGEWMPLMFFRNTGKGLENVTETTGVAHLKGWWNSIVSGDFDKDGDMDYIAGNLGLNTNYTASEKQPLTLYAKDFDSNGSMDPVLACYMKAEDGTMKPFPMHNRDDLSAQMVQIRRQYLRYSSYAKATVADVLQPLDQKDMLRFDATWFATSYFENLGNGKFRAKALPVQAQVAPVNGMLAQDVTGDGNMDVLMVGNNYGTELFTGRYDAFVGLVLQGDGKGNFKPLSISESGFLVNGDAKGLARLVTAADEDLFLVTQNRDSLKVFKSNNKRATQQSQLLHLQPFDAWAELTFQDGKKQRQEFHYGASYLSQSSRKIRLPQDVVSVKVYDYKGKSRDLQQLAQR